MISRVLTKLKRDGLLAFCMALVKYPFQSKKRKSYEKMLTLVNPKDKFSEIYKNNLWSSSESLSGAGSEVAYTEPLRKWLVSNILKLKVKDFVDAPCGDYNWMKFVTPEVNINYIGLDIVDSVISKNKLEYGSPTVDFRLANICEDVLPACDLIMVRDCLFHLSYDDINKFLSNLARTDYKYLLTTTHEVEREFKNSNIITGDFRIIDLFSEPFNFDAKLARDKVNDYPIGYYSTKREMILVEKQFVPISLSSTKLDLLN
jgi:hypothetical protein